MRVRVSGGSSWMYGQSLRNDMLSNTLLSRSRPPWPTRKCDVRSRRARPRSSSPPWMSRRLARRNIVVMFFSVLLDGADAVGISSGYRKLNILTFIAADRKAAILYRRADAVREQWSGTRWCAILFEGLLFVSMYLPRSQAPGWEEIADLVLEDVTQLRARVCREYGITHFAYAADVNVELQPWIAEYTGGGLHVPIARSEGAREKERREEEQKLREKVEGWMVGQHLRASNSFGARLPTWNRYQLHSRPSVLDYVFIFQWVVMKGEAQVDTLYQGSARDARARLSDHALLRVGVALPH
eukprot:2038406-Pyramimonas_sp.AAC.1